MKVLSFSSLNFNVFDTLSCGQVFRYRPFKNGYLVFSGSRACYLYQLGDTTNLEINEEDEEFFLNYFDIQTDYLSIINALSGEEEIIKKSSKLGQGIRILRQDYTESLFSFIISQNNNIPRIKSIIEKLCTSFGEKKKFLGETYYTFPQVDALSKAEISSLRSFGLGYRAEYVLNLAKEMVKGLDLNLLSTLSDEELKVNLLKIKGVGPKVADCVMLFGYSRTGRFPVDTWLEKVYLENFNGKEKDREKISAFFTEKYKNLSGYVQQYLFYYKRSLEKTLK